MPQQAQKYKTGYTEGILTDHSRKDWDGNEFRPISWSAWYPADLDSQAEELLIGSPNMPLFSMGEIASDAKISSHLQKWPLVLFSHGTGGSAQGMGWLGARLSQNGYICVGVNHHGNTELEAYRPEGFLCWWERAADLSFILDNLSNLGEVCDRIDPANVFVVGFSLGAHTALSLAGATTSLKQFGMWLSENTDIDSGPREFPYLGAHVSKLLKSSEQFRLSYSRHNLSYENTQIKAFVTLAPAPPIRALQKQSLETITKPVRIPAIVNTHSPPVSG